MASVLSFTWARSVMPRRLFGRTLLILIVPVVGVQLVLAAVFIQRHFEGVTRQMAAAAGAEMRYILSGLETGLDVANTGARLGLSLDFLPEETLTPGAALDFWDVSGRQMVLTLNRSMDHPLFIDTVTERKAVIVSAQTDEGVLRAVIPRNRLMASNPHLLFTWMLFTSLILVTISVLFLRNQVRPIRELAQAAEAFGKGRAQPFRPRGAEEVRRAGSAFIAMRERIERQIENRTTMLSGVSHDLRTPLTRMRLALDMAEPGPETEELKRDVAEMERMIEGFLTFARGDAVEEISRVDVVTMTRQLALDSRRAGAQLATVLLVDTPENTEVSIRALAVRRALQNLLSNAHRHADRVKLTLRLNEERFEVEIEDDGPGIPKAEREQALRPFTRLDPARNQDEGGGVGLGLSITADVASSHGGSLRLDKSEELGGLRAVFRIPR
ncbi:MAG: ATP-binding protein [Pseudomonadota bacterium]